MTEAINDFELIKQFLNGSEAAFNKIVIKYQDKIYWHARRMTGNHLDADEIVQEVLLVMYNKLKTFQFKSSLYTWIYRITSTRSINLLRKNQVKRFFSIEESEAAGLRTSTDIIKNIEDKEKVDRINKALQKLPAKQREVFIMRTYEELSYDEISEITGKSVGGLKANYFHAVNKLTELVKK
ncbi:MAG: RNA polymerase sigma factor [Ignavibacteriaceae bacterium]